MKNLEVFVYFEPCLMCSMALVHSRISKLFFIKPNNTYQGAINVNLNIRKMKLNHKYEVYRYCTKEDEFINFNN